MNTLQRWITATFDVLLAPLERVGMEFALIVASGVFGIVALVLFKLLSPQGAIRREKSRIKGLLIEIRLYRDDLRLVTRATAKIFWLNLRYLGLSAWVLGPLVIPFALVAGQLVTRYGFDPLPVQMDRSTGLAGEGVTLGVAWSGPDRIQIHYPEGVTPVSPLLQVPEQGRAFQEFVAQRPGHFEIELERGGVTTAKRIWVGERPSDAASYPAVQPLRVSGWERVLWPAEPGLDGWLRIELRYPASSLGWLPGSGPSGVLLNMLLFSMLFGLLALKPLGVTI
jgi:hypothetical protein